MVNRPRRPPMPAAVRATIDQLLPGVFEPMPIRNDLEQLLDVHDHDDNSATSEELEPGGVRNMHDCVGPVQP